MLRKILATALIGGVAAGLVVSVVEFAWIDKLILQAEIYEHGGAAAAGADALAVDMERAFLSVVTNILNGVGFALLLVGAIALSGRDVDWRRGILWGLAGYAVFTLAPALGLPPEPPGIDAGPLAARQTWWLATVLATCLALALLVFARRAPWRVAGLVLLVLPHIIGAPHIDLDGGNVPADLIRSFVIASLVTTGIFWLVLGGATGFLYRRLA